ncbi:MAG: peroxiredoxin [Halofilum sp. (in: g-proteobacteria)]|nr:peroxiredoxin [Halofilum sp. (in: g-proteobacteria)]
MSPPRIGEPAPNFELPATGDRTLRLSDLRGHNVVVYFYPRDATPGCTTEGRDFRDREPDFEAANTRILGISRDSLKSHEKFRDKHGFGFDLVSDPDEEACNAFDVIREKNLYGRKVRGIERSTFLIDAEGVLRHEWRGVKVPGHADDVLATVQQL